VEKNLMTSIIFKNLEILRGVYTERSECAQNSCKSWQVGETKMRSSERGSSMIPRILHKITKKERG
jgi:hypothetical protein